MTLIIEGGLKYPEEITSELIDKMVTLFENKGVLYKNDNTVEETYNLKEWQINKVAVDLCQAVDEFYLEDENSSESIYVEVVTEEVAISNDMDFLMGADGFKKEEYRLGEDWSYYLYLGKSATNEYYYRLM